MEVVVLTSYTDCHKVYGTVKNLAENVQADRIIVIGCADVFQELSELWTNRIIFVDENDILPIDEVRSYYRKLVPVGGNSPNWYYQQFLKLSYAEYTDAQYYLTWDADTALVRKCSFFDEGSKKPFFDMKTEFHKPYFTTISKLFPDVSKVAEGSFVSEHMVFSKQRVLEMQREIMKNEKIEGRSYWQKIFHAADTHDLRTTAAFSEFETYGSWMSVRHPNEYLNREWNSLRNGVCYYPAMEKALKDSVFLAKEFDAVSIEYGHSDKKYIMTPACRLFWNPLFKYFWNPTKLFDFMHDRGIAYWPGEKEEYKKKRKEARKSRHIDKMTR